MIKNTEDKTKIESIVEESESANFATDKDSLENLSEEPEFITFITDLSIDEDLRFECLEKYYQQFRDTENCIDLINKITGMYMFSGSKILSNFLLRICKHSSISTFLKLESAKGLLSFSENLEKENPKSTDTEFEEIKKESNNRIRIRNAERFDRGFDALNTVCKISHELPTPVRIEAICMMMENDKYKTETNSYFIQVINDDKINCDYRYKTILSLENKKQILNKGFFQNEAFTSFFFNNKNMTMYRILSGQYLLQNTDTDTILRDNVENTLFEFANDNELDYNLRADSADTILSLGREESKIKARNIIMFLGNISGQSKTIFENAQNVHSSEIEESVKDILEFLNTVEIMQENDNYITFENIQEKINNILENQKEINDNENNKCHQCKRTPKGKENILCDEINLTDTHCSQKCIEQCYKHNKIKISLNRIYIDRVLYSKYNNSLINIMLKIWSYLQEHENKEQLLSRLLEELEDMSGTCSTGFASRLCNVVSGFGQFNIKISWEDQIVANFIGRLNACSRKITDPSSRYYTDKNVQNDIVELWLLKNKDILNSCRDRIFYSEHEQQKILEGRKNVQGGRNICELEIEKESRIKMSQIIELFLEDDKETKVRMCIEDFSDDVLDEMTLNNSKYEKRKNFQRFFRTHLSDVRNELYEEFKEYVTDEKFDLHIRKAIFIYEGSA
jgi:hypothetical protein